MQTPGQMQRTGANIPRDAVSPFQLTSMAIRGDLDSEDFGGPNYVLQDMRRGNARGQDIVEAAINQGIISGERMEDRGYVTQVNQILRMRMRDFRGS